MITLTMAAALLVATTSVPAACAATPTEDRLPAIIARMAGQDPAWLVADPHWAGTDGWDKSVLVLARHALGPLTARARQLDGPAIARFRRDAETIEVLSVPDPAGWSVTPGGASAEVMSRYAFIMMLVQYPARGCWEFSVDLGAATVRIIRDLRD
jgi:hypothetical protein